MRSTFMGLETAKRAIFTQQSALYTTGHNIANANTPGYSRQRVDFQATNGFPSPGMNSPQVPGHLGSGVEAGAVNRYRDTFLDVQFRQQNTGLGFWNAQSEGLSRMEEVMNEPSDQGLAKVMDQFWSSLEDLSVNPEDSGARAVVLQRGNAVADTFNYLDNRLNINKKDIGSQIDNTNFDVNGILRQIHEVNQQIGDIEPNGYIPNDLYDQRDSLIDELSSHLSIKVTYTNSGGQSAASAQGKATIELLDGNQKPMAFLVDGKVDQVNQIKVQMDDDRQYVKSIEVGPAQQNGTIRADKSFDMNQFTSQGSLLGHIKNFGYTEDANGTPVLVEGNYPEMLNEIDKIAFQFAQEFNKVHQSGYSLAEIESGVKANTGDGYTFFDYASINDTPADYKGTAGSLKLHDDMVDKPNRIAAANESEATAGVAYSGNGGNALDLARVKDVSLPFDPENTNVMNYYQGVIGNMGVKSSEANRLGSNNLVLLDSIQRNRDSVSSVSLDEEMTNMIKYQQAFNAASRNVTVVDEMLDKIINGMGLVGR